MIKHKKRNRIYLLFLLLAIIFPSAYGRKARDADNIKRIITFTTQNSVKLEVTFNATPSANTKYNLKIIDGNSGKVIFDKAVTASLNSSAGNKMIFSVNDLNVNEWTPVHPNLYQLSFTEILNGKIEEQTQRIGFRFFESKDGNLYLNGHPIFLRGIAINPPGRGIPDSIETSRKFARDYITFMKSIHVNIIRIPDDSTWYNVCDELGMMVFGGNYSGSVDGEKPPKDYDKAVAWYENEKFAPIAHHPSLMIYAMTNEVNYTGSLAEPWRKFLTYAHDQLLKWDNTRVYIGNAGYGYGQSGDICDLHRYWGWYYNSPFTFLHIRYNEDIVPFKKKVQPVTFTECVGNYTGPGGEYNLTPNHKNPGSQLNWTGHADWNLQKQLADEHQSFTFKQATELFRRLRSVNPELSGIFPFTILYYNWDNVQQFIDMDPKPVTKQAKLSYSPILISWENWTSQVYAGNTIHPIVHIVNDNDDFNDLKDAKFIYQVTDAGSTIFVSDSIVLSNIPYYATWKKKLSIKLPVQLSDGNYRLVGKIIKNEKVISANFDKLFIANKNFITSGIKSKQPIFLYDPSGKTSASFDKLVIHYQKINALKNIPAFSLLVIGENAAGEEIEKQSASVKQFIKDGGKVLCLRQDERYLPIINKILTHGIKNVTIPLDTPVYPPPPRPSRNGYYVNPERPGHPVFYGINREQLKIWSDYTNWDESQKGFPAIYPVTDGFVPVNKNDLGNIAVLGDYGVALEGITIAEFFDGKGSVLLIGLDLINRTNLDPVADRMLTNLISYMSDGKEHTKYPLVTAPIVWGDYTSEKGLLTGINSGLLLNSKPRRPENNTSKIRLTKQGDMFLGASGGFNTRPGVQYVHYGRRMFGPYSLRGFGNIPEPDAENNNIGEGYFWCNIPEGKNTVSTIVWNPSDENLSIKIKVNNKEVNKQINAGDKATVEVPVNASTIKMNFTGDRRLVLLQTSFK